MNVLIVTQVIAHYRKPIYEKLCGNSDRGLVYKIMADERTNVPSLKIITRSELDSCSPLSHAWMVRRCTWLPFGLMWQQGVVQRAIGNEYDMLIMTGDAKFLTVWVVLVLRRLMGRKTLLWTHGLRKPDQGIKKLVRLVFYSLADGLLLYGFRGRKLLENGGLRKSNLSIVYNSLNYLEQQEIDRKINSQDVDEMKRHYSIDRNSNVLLTSGRLIKSKRVDLLIKLMPRLQLSHKVCLIIVGDGPEIDGLRDLANELEVTDSVIFVGACYDEKKIACLMRCADLFVLPGDAGLSVIHGMTYGLPVITHNSLATQGPEVEAIVENATGSLYKLNDIESLKAAIELWLNKQKLERDTVQAACRRKVAQQYSPEAQLKIINDVVSDMLLKKPTEKFW